jgi:hypothetical protein
VNLSRYAASWLGVFLVACSSGDETRPSEAVSGPDPAPAFAMVQDGDAIYVARPTALERIDTRTGERTTVAGPEWAQCPRDHGIVWMSSPLDFTYPELVISGTTAFVAHERCGLWSFDFATKTSHMLVDPTTEAKAALMKSGAPYPQGSLWNGKDGPYWQDPWGISLARDGDGLLVCFNAFSREDLADSPDAGPSFRGRVELWSVALDGTPRELLTFIPRERMYELGESFCGAVVPDETSILFATDHAVVRFDRATRSLTPLATGMQYGPAGLATDGTDVYFEHRNAIVSVPRAGGEMKTLLASTGAGTESVRVLAGIDGDYVYFNDGYALKRMRKDGSDLIEFAHGDPQVWIMPRMIGVTPDFVYFERITNAPILEDSAAYLGTLFRAPK